MKIWERTIVQVEGKVCIKPKTRALLVCPENIKGPVQLEKSEGGDSGGLGGHGGHSCRDKF